jgi:2-keto-4-pentenoate hydratase/2-oxohepta-3-ene-1,7-dioic acid hydratase in catechol pathway
MKLARCRAGSDTFWALVDPDVDRADVIHGDLSEWGAAVTADFASGPPLTGESRSLSDVELLAPLASGAAVVAAGATYAKHVADLGLVMPEKPAAFLKTRNSVVGPFDEISYPSVTEALDYEAELVVVVGAPVVAGEAMSSILGYCVGNEVSARDLQFGGGVTGMDMFSAKALDDTGPIGPWITTRDEFGDVHPDLEIELSVDGEVRQHDRTSSMVWGVDFILEYVDARSRVGTGDVLFTGTTSGVGHEDGRYLQPGQLVEVTIERLGTVRNVVGQKISRGPSAS